MAGLAINNQQPAIEDRKSQIANPPLRLVFWETTAGCNLDCIHCRRLDVATEMMENDLTTKESFLLVDQIAQVGRPILVLSGGEPLFRPDIFDIARHAVGVGLTVSMATNGTLVTDVVAAKVKDAGIVRCSLSLDGADEATHDSFRQLPGSFYLALRGARLLREAGVEVQINTTVAKHNDGQLERLYDLAKSLGAVALHLFMLVPVGCGVEIAETEMLEAQRYEEVLNEFYGLAQRGELQMKATCAPHYYRVLRQRAKTEGRKVTLQTEGMTDQHRALAATTKGCLAGTGVCFISHEGNVFPCGYLPVPAGSVRAEDFGDVWRDSPVFATLRNPELLGGKCGVCEYRMVCMGCRARAYYQHGDFMAEEPFCVYEPKRRGRDQ